MHLFLNVNRIGRTEEDSVDVSVPQDSLRKYIAARQQMVAFTKCDTYSLLSRCLIGIADLVLLIDQKSLGYRNLLCFVREATQAYVLYVLLKLCSGCAI
jgi:hypothetical protein